VCRAARIPVYALGGITPERAKSIIGAAAPAEAMRAMLAALRG
jgi:thiamine monophosphate synthase